MNDYNKMISSMFVEPTENCASYFHGASVRHRLPTITTGQVCNQFVISW